VTIFKFGFGIILFLFSIGTAGCSQVSSQQSASNLIPEPGPVIIAKASELSEVNYFRGGWYGPAEMPNWSHDITFKFNTDETVSISGKLPEDAYCGKSGSLTKTEAEAFLAKLNGLTLGHMEFGAIDGGVSMLVLKYKTGEEKTIYLPGSDFIGEDQLYATAGGDALRDHIVAIYGNLATWCQ
jgi:hypothetical protein